jgi:pantothenate synthetase
MSLFVNPAQFGEAPISRATRATRSATSSSPRGGRRPRLRAVGDEMYPPGFQTWVDVTELGAILEGSFARALPRRRDVVPQALQRRAADRVYFGRRTRSRSR